MAWGKAEATKCLLELGAQIDAIDKDGKSSVFWATKLDSVEILKVVIYRKSGNFHVKIIYVLNIHIDLFLWVYGTHENILT